MIETPPPPAIEVPDDDVEEIESMSTQYLQCVFSNGRWDKLYVDKPKQPADGFTILAPKDDREADVLCRPAYEKAAPDARKADAREIRKGVASLGVRRQSRRSGLSCRGACLFSKLASRKDVSQRGGPGAGVQQPGADRREGRDAGDRRAVRHRQVDTAAPSGRARSSRQRNDSRCRCRMSRR